MATDICVLFSANDAYMRDFRIIVPSDCVAAQEEERSQQALRLMQQVLKAKITLSANLEFHKNRQRVTIKAGSNQNK